ncbi:MAG: DNA-binding protein WhiA [Ruminococcaceae bacterium]|nr:DNA-binding protein WhiA [Oscillospiraceae bacterium]
MSFSQEVKRELCAVDILEDCDALGECYGILLFANLFRQNGVRVITGNEDLARRVEMLFLRAFGLRVEPRRGSKEGRYVFEITKKQELSKIFNAFGLDPNASGVRLNRAILEEDCCKAAFLRGAFLSGGSVADPESRYHLEFVTPHYVFSTEMTAFLMDAEFQPRITRRQSKYVLYFKSSEAIEDFLVQTGAPMSALAVMQAKVVKDVRNQINRHVNCETANITKTVDAAAAQIRAIHILEEDGRLALQPKVVQEAARARLASPEASLATLAAALDPPVSRATLSYRLKKLVELAEDKP